MFSTLGALALFFSITSLGAGTSPAPLPTRYAHPDPQQNVANFQYLTGISNKDFHTVGATTYIETYSINNPGTYVLVEDIGYQGRNSVTTDGGACAIFINSNNVVLDLGNKTLYNNSGATLTSVQKGIDVAHNLRNISIKNGNIEGFQDTGVYVRSGCNSVRLQDLTIDSCVKYGIVFSGGLNATNTDSLQISNCIIDNVMVSNTTGLATDANGASGLFLNNCHNTLVNNSSFLQSNAGTLSTQRASYGALICTSTNVRFFNCDASANYGSNAAGFLLTSSGNATIPCSSCLFKECTANSNIGSDDSSGIGFDAAIVNGCMWEECIANGNYGQRVGIGFGYLTANYCRTIDCQALNNRGGSSGDVELTDGARGFNSQSGEGNIWEDCIGNGQRCTSTSTNALCAGFHLQTERNATIRGCDAISNNKGDDTPWGVGINLVSTCVDCLIDNCKFLHNLTATGVGAWHTVQGMGIRDTDITSSTVVTNCFFLNNGGPSKDKAVSLFYNQPTGGGDLAQSICLTTTILPAVNSGGQTGNYPATIRPYQNVMFSSAN